ncbi:MAG: hypothetical protein RLZZ241_597 [Bacteroidota bacterium]|jgi:acetolactate decarboxylase
MLMKTRAVKDFTFLLFNLLAFSLASAQNVFVAGRMSDVMWQGKLDGVIQTDSISQKGMYGLGPLEGLRGEILVLDGITYVSGINKDELFTQRVSGAKAPFFVYGVQKDFESISLPDSIRTLRDLEQFLDTKFSGEDAPFIFLLEGTWSSIQIHSVNLPKGKSVSSPTEAHEGLQNFNFSEITGTVVGFFSRNHKAVFTHHDTYMHCHFISEDRKIMGHLDGMLNESGMVQLKIPKKE